MKPLGRMLTSSLLCLVALVGWVATATGQNEPEQEASKPFAVVSIAPLERSLPDLTYLLSAFNMPEVTGMMELMTGFYTKGIDQSQPIGIFLSMESDTDTEPKVQICIPVTDHGQWFEAIAGMGIEPEDLGNGNYEIAAGGQYLYAKVADGWLHMAQSEDSLSHLNTNPTVELGDLPQRYNVCLRLDLEQISPEARRAAIEQMQSQLEQNVAEQFGDQLGEQLDEAKDAGQAQMDELEELVNDVQQIVLGFLIEPDQKRVAIDAAIQFLPNTQLAKQMDSQASVKTEFDKLKVSNEAARFRLTTVMQNDDEKAAAKSGFKGLIQQIEQSMSRTDLPAERSELLKRLISQSTSVIEQTIEEGVVDAVASMSFEEDVLRILAGVRVADSKAIESQIKEFVTGLAGESQVQFEADYSTEGAWRLHRLRGKLPEGDKSISEILGQEIEIFIAASDKKLIVCLAPNGEEALRECIRQLDGTQPVSATPMELVVKLGEMARLAQKANPDPSLEDMLASLPVIEENDHIKVITTALPRGFVVRATIEEGAIKTFGTMVKSSGMVPGF